MTIVNTQAAYLKPAPASCVIQNPAQADSPLQSKPIDCFTKFRGNKKPDHKPSNEKSFWKSPAPKLLSGCASLAAGIGIKVFGLTTVIGAPLLLPIGIGLAVAGIALGIWRIGQACSSPNGTSDSAPSPKASEPVSSKPTIIPEPVPPIDPGKLREQKFLEYFPTHHVQRLLRMKQDAKTASKYQTFVETFLDFIQSQQDKVKPLASLSDKEKGRYQKLADKLLENDNRLLVDTGRLMAYNLGNSPESVEKKLWPGTLPTTTPGRFNFTHYNNTRRHQEPLNVTSSSNGRMCTLKSLFLVHGHIQLKHSSSQPIIMEVGRSNTDDSVDYVLNQKGQTYASMTVKKGTPTSPHCTMTGLSLKGIPANYKLEACTAFIKMAIEEAYTQDMPILRYKGTLIPSSLLKQYGFVPFSNANEYVLQGEPFFNTLSRLPQPPISHQALKAFKEGYLLANT